MLCHSAGIEITARLKLHFFVVVLQNEKNEEMTTNVFMNLVSCIYDSIVMCSHILYNCMVRFIKSFFTILSKMCFSSTRLFFGGVEWKCWSQFCFWNSVKLNCTCLLTFRNYIILQDLNSNSPTLFSSPTQSSPLLPFSLPSSPLLTLHLHSHPSLSYPLPSPLFSLSSPLPPSSHPFLSSSSLSPLRPGQITGWVGTQRNMTTSRSWEFLQGGCGVRISTSLTSEWRQGRLHSQNTAV